MIIREFGNVDSQRQSAISNVCRARRHAAFPTLGDCKNQDSLLQLIGRHPGRVYEPLPLEACCDYSSDCVAHLGTHPLIAATDLAYSDHRPLILSPDMIWVTVLQGLAQHVSNSSEQYRHKLVNHSGKQAIKVVISRLMEGSPENLWDEMIAQFSAEMQRRLGDSYARFVSDFTTTGPHELAACQVALMDLYSPFFDYVAVGICGIPRITLEGEVRDWKKLRKKIDLLEEFELDWWLKELRPICDHFVQAAKGNVDQTFWRNIHKNEKQYGSSRINGWMVKFIPYVEDSRTNQYTVRNPTLTDSQAVLTTAVLPSGISSVPLLYQEGNGSACGTTHKCYDLLGGFIGVTQDATTKALRPKLGWAVQRGGAASRLLQMLARFNPSPPRSNDTFSQIERQVLGARGAAGIIPMPQLSSEMRHFYGMCNGVTIRTDYDTLVIRPFEDCDVFRNPPLFDPAQPTAAVEQHRRDVWDCWLRFGDFADGTFVAIALLPTYSGSRSYYWRVLHGGRKVEIDGKVPIIATSLNRFLQHVLTSDNQPLSFTPLSVGFDN